MQEFINMKINEIEEIIKLFRYLRISDGDRSK